MEQQSIEPIVKNLWWVIPDKLAGVRKPTADELRDLQAAGIRAIVSVLDDPSNLDVYEQLDMPFRWLPIQGGTPPSRDQIQELAYFIDEQDRQSRSVAANQWIAADGNHAGCLSDSCRFDLRRGDPNHPFGKSSSRTTIGSN